MRILEVLQQGNCQVDPGLPISATIEAERRRGTPFPTKITELLALLRGFSCATGYVDFSGSTYPFEFDLLPGGIPVMGDQFGNFWVIDPISDGNHDLPVVFACHDPPVLLLQFDNIETFVEALVSRKDSLTGATHQLCSRVDEGDEGAWIEVVYARSSGDATLRRFAESLGDRYRIMDLRQKFSPVGFSWHPTWRLARFADELLFAQEAATADRPSSWRRIKMLLATALKRASA